MVPLPCATDQVTALLVMPETAAVNCTCPVSVTEVFAGETVTDTGWGTLTTTSADANLVLSALLTALTV